ncbi:hypothetical protein [Pseudomonas sp. PB106]|uniref:hypothetical protein n=1 Tax=Pseudomonas sp. PB106 TaxID=2494699 RepID=UPI00131B9603|nr:hypothetical protein [Pseudomonas sp. PB106]KAE9648106.1 hypothetical protein EJA71_05780 [Pseudomonas sp. PB106]
MDSASSSLRNQVPTKRRIILFADPLIIDGVTAADGYIPLPILLAGTKARIFPWAETSFDDTLVVYWEQGGATQEIYRRNRPIGPLPPVFEVDISPGLMANNGIAFIYYVITAFGIDDPSPHKQLIIDHSQQDPVTDLPEVDFVKPVPTLWGYYNCDSSELDKGVSVKVPPLPVAQESDELTIEWSGYKSLNGYAGANDELVVSEAFFSSVHTLSTADVEKGLTRFFPYTPCVQPLVHGTNSALVVYRITRKGVLVGSSLPALIKVDRRRPGQSLPCFA